jgi:hypothetical protein
MNQQARKLARNAAIVNDRCEVGTDCAICEIGIAVSGSIMPAVISAQKRKPQGRNKLCAKFQDHGEVGEAYLTEYFD